MRRITIFVTLALLAMAIFSGAIDNRNQTLALYNDDMPRTSAMRLSDRQNQTTALSTFFSTL